jgi:hypothetical protein
MADLILKQSRIELQTSMAEAAELVCSKILRIYTCLSYHQKRELASIRSQLEIKKGENSALTSQLTASKKAAIQSVKSASQKYGPLGAAFK